MTQEEATILGPRAPGTYRISTGSLPKKSSVERKRFSGAGPSYDERPKLATIKSLFSIPDDAPFLDIDPKIDNKRFLDSHRIRFLCHSSKHALAATELLDDFLDTVTGKIMSGDELGARRLLSQFREPSETRLGLSKTSFQGRGGASEIGRRIASILTEDLRPLMEVGILKHLENLPLFVEGVDRDITSDIVTRIVFGTLTEFTHEMMELYPQLGAHTGKAEYQLWDRSTHTWVYKEVELPLANGSPLLLAPESWTGKTLLMSAGRYYNKTLLDWIQEQKTVMLPDGTIARPTKDELRERGDLPPNRFTILRLTLEAYEVDIDLIERFTAFVAQKHTELQLKAA